MDIKTLSERNDWEIYVVCKWEDDSLQADEPDLAGGANQESLREAQKNFLEIGVKLLHWKNTSYSKYEKDGNSRPLQEK
ncbi:CPCC family cysteine-rich protein [Niallia sp. FSL M8-0099]|uniref:CPCC family cysteine-rich protein n=1 Tax=Niallia sp. FSL M8-0099 TaxID=2954519 RepID=UPI0030FB2BB1